MAKVTIQIELQYEFDVNSTNAAIRAVKDVDLPEEYVENSFNIVQILMD